MNSTKNKKRSTAKKGVAQHVRDQIAVGALSAVMPVEQACSLVGYSRNSRPAKSLLSSETTDQIRERLQQTPGFRLDDSATWYRKKANSKAVADSDQIRAMSRLDSILGHDAPQKQEITERREITASVAVLHELCARFGSSPADLKYAIDNAQNAPVLTPKVDSNLIEQRNTLNCNEIQNVALDVQSNDSNTSQVVSGTKRKKGATAKKKK